MLCWAYSHVHVLLSTLESESKVVIDLCNVQDREGSYYTVD